MNRTSFITSIASLAVIAATPALAAPGGGGGGPGAGAGAGANVRAGIMGSVHGNAGANANANANANAIDRASARSNVRTSTTTTTEPLTGTRIRPENRMSTNTASTRTTLRSASTASAHTSLTGITTGMSVIDTSGATIGTVSGVRTVGNGSAKSVQVTLTDGSIINLSANSLTLSDNVLTTSSLTSNVNSQGAAHANINGLIHASPNSALSLAGVTTLTGLATGLTVNDTGGTTVGTVSNILTNTSGAVVAIQVDLSGGGTATIPAGSLSMSGTTVVTSFTDF